MTQRDIGFEEALVLTLSAIKTLEPIEAPLWESSGLVLAEAVHSRVDSPSLTTASRDGFAVLSQEVAQATVENPIRLRIVDTAVAGGSASSEVERGTTIKIMTGAPLPEGANAVVAVEYTQEEGDEVLIKRDAPPGCNIFSQGIDVSVGQPLAEADTELTPPMTGLFAAGGHHQVSVYPPPRVAVVATGDEVVAPGKGSSLEPGQLYASNLVTLRSWLNTFGMPNRSAVAPDEPDLLYKVIDELLDDVDVVLTSGGAWKSARDRSAEVLERLGFQLVYHRVRLAPGKAIAFGIRENKYAFCLPGGPPSNEMAFLQLALPALRKMAGHRKPPFPTVRARLSESVRKHRDDPTWTTFYQCKLNRTDECIIATPCKHRSRLVCQAIAEGLIVIPAGILEYPAHSETLIQLTGNGC